MFLVRQNAVWTDRGPFRDSHERGRVHIVSRASLDAPTRSTGLTAWLRHQNVPQVRTYRRRRVRGTL